MTPLYLLALALTLAVELPLVALAGGPPRGRLVRDALLLNLFTHPLAVLAHRHLAEPGDPWGTAFLAIECLVVLAETGGYRWVSGVSWTRAAGLALLANGVTAALGPLLW